MPDISIEQLEAAINIWRNRKPSPEGSDQAPALCAEARALADVYGTMIFKRLVTVDTATFNEVQTAAYAAATPERYA
ncbi:MAG: DUF3717 domain-containing protein [Pseudomonadota bacterium]|mgnify:CR=1 FL=1|jgi:hypothetical protein|uniref:PF12512 family protein n=1 Tax=Paraburkholderia phytofirmans OLGA172 TaxID=1417228 RepID=A0A167WPK2_9BURK|nr:MULTISPECIES: DUF3717 domain-containing protein [Burkholderiaceae]ANB77999.1 hypothetical protein AYM40_37180 [Paraburkholderia phytofirmans OLGA172]